jgi:hypothetical protein
MEAAMVEMAASEPRERLLAFVEEVVRPLRCVCGGVVPARATILGFVCDHARRSPA